MQRRREVARERVSREQRKDGKVREVVEEMNMAAMIAAVCRSGRS